MPTEIHFAGQIRITVEEDPGQVAEAFAGADGSPFLLTAGTAGPVYVNPSLVAFWSAPESAPNQEDRRDPPPPEPPPPTGRKAVTDIWGEPLRKKPRR